MYSVEYEQNTKQFSITCILTEVAQVKIHSKYQSNLNKTSVKFTKLHCTKDDTYKHRHLIEVLNGYNILV